MPVGKQCSIYMKAKKCKTEIRDLNLSTHPTLREELHINVYEVKFTELTQTNDKAN